nr:MAG TPA: hypothetical protein [Caudoviricetes sp.]
MIFLLWITQLSFSLFRLVVVCSKLVFITKLVPLGLDYCIVSTCCIVSIY